MNKINNHKIIKYLIVFNNSLCRIFIILFNDFLSGILQLNRKYHWLVGSLIYMLLNSIVPLYYIFTGQPAKIYNEGTFNSENLEFVTFGASFRLSVYLFLFVLIVFIIKQLSLEWKISEIDYKKNERLQQLDDLLESHTIENDRNK